MDQNWKTKVDNEKRQAVIHDETMWLRLKVSYIQTRIWMVLLHYSMLGILVRFNARSLFSVLYLCARVLRTLATSRLKLRIVSIQITYHTIWLIRLPNRYAARFFASDCFVFRIELLLFLFSSSYCANNTGYILVHSETCKVFELNF